jgi:hypothetical protein
MPELKTIDITVHPDLRSSGTAVHACQDQIAKEYQRWMNQGLRSESTGLASPGHGSSMNAAAIIKVGISAATNSSPAEMLKKHIRLLLTLLRPAGALPRQ